MMLTATLEANTIIMESFNDQIVLITGASRGIGKEIAKRFLELGATVIGVYASNTQAADDLQKACTEYQNKLFLFQCDISKNEDVQHLFQLIEEQFSYIDVLINNAGIRADAIVALMKESDWRSVIETNLNGTFYMSQQAVPLMMKKKYGRIITITSPISHLGFPGQGNYAASKAGQIGFSKSLAKEVARKKITVNCISPGFIDTDFIGDLEKDLLLAYKKMIPMRRFGKTEEVASAVLFLASKQASYITGSVLEVTGGL